MECEEFAQDPGWKWLDWLGPHSFTWSACSAQSSHQTHGATFLSHHVSAEVRGKQGLYNKQLCLGLLWIGI